MEIDIASFGRAALFLGVPFVLMVFYFQWKWARDCDRNIRVLVAEQSGGGRFSMAPKKGGEVSIKNPDTGAFRTWPINELATIDVTYPGVGFVPKFMQKTIRLAIVSEGDWEPLLNRSPHMRKIASPDVIKEIEAIAEVSDEKTKEALKYAIDGISTAPTRQMIASPALLGNLLHERISELAVTVSKDIINPLNEAIKNLGRRLNPTITYVMIGVLLVMMAVTLIRVMPMAQQIDENTAKLEAIQKALGVVTGTPSSN